MISNRAKKGHDPLKYQALLDENYTLKEEIESLKARLEEAEELKRAISEGDLDALVIYRPEGELVFTLDSADRAYRILVETMNEGTATIACDGTILYCNRQFANLLETPPQAVVGSPIKEFMAPECATIFKALLKQNSSIGEINLRTKDGISVPVYLSVTSVDNEKTPDAWCLVVTDLSEQKKNEEIVAAERLARSIIEQAAEAIIVCDTEGKITRFSNAMSRICRCDPTFQKLEDIIDLRFSNGEDAGKKIFPVISALKGSAILGVEATLELKDSQKSYLLLSSSPLRNDDGKIIGCVVTFTDITERKHAEQRLYESEQREMARSEELEKLLDAVPTAVWIAHDPEARKITGNKLSYEWLQLPEGTNVSKCAPEGAVPETFKLFKDGVELSPQEMPIRVAASGKEISNYEFDFLNWEGKVKRVLGNAVPLFDEKRNPRGSVSAFVDITERKEIEDALRESEGRLSIAKEAAKLGIHDYDVISNTIQWDSRVRELWGIGPEDLVTYETFMAGLHPEDRVAAQKAVDKGLDPAGNGKYYAEYRVVNFKDGVERWIAANGQTFFEKGRAVRLVGTVQEITERKRAEEALQKSEKNLAIELETARHLQLISQKLIHGEGIEVLYEQILDTATSILRADFASIQIYHPERGTEGELQLLGYRGFSEQAAKFWQWVRPTSQSSCGIAMRTLQRVIVSDVEEYESILGSEDLEMYLKTGIRAVQTTPLFSRSGTLLGMLSTHWKKIHELMEADERNLDILARQAADLIARKGAEDTLRKSEERYRLLFTNMTEAFFLAEIICDGNGKPCDYRFVELNPAYEYNMGIKREQILGKSALEELPRASRLAMEKFGDVALSGESTNFELFSNIANKYFDIYAFSPEKGKFAAVFRDITERKEAEQALKRSEKHFELLSEANALLLSSKNPEATIQTIAENIARNLNFDVFFNYVFDEVQEKLHLNAYGGVSEELAREIEWLNTGSAICGCVALDGCRIVSEDVQNNTDEKADLVRSIGVQAYACHPLQIGEKTIGTLSFGVKSRTGFQEDELELMRSVADQVSVAMHRAQTEKALRESEELARQRMLEIEDLYQNAPVGLCMLDKELRYIRINERLAEINGVPAVDHIGKRVRDVLPPELADEAEPDMFNVIKTGEPKLNVELVGETFWKPGVKRSWLEQWLPITDAEGYVIGLNIVVEETTERKKAEEALRESEQRYRAVIENSRDAIILTDTAGEGKIVSVNQAAAEMFGWTEEEMIGFTRKDIIDTENPNFKNMMQERSYIGLTRCELPYKRKDGSLFPGELVSACFTQADGKEHAVSIIRNITERKKNEEALKNAYENLEEKVKERTLELEIAYESLKRSEKDLAEAQKMAQLGNWDWNIVTGKLNWSAETYRIFGFSSQEVEITYDTFINHIHSEDLSYVNKAIKEALDGKKTYDIDHRIISANGAEYTVHGYAKVTFDENNKPVRMKGTIQDITERRKAEEALAKMDKIRIKEIHHRIKNNLQVISSLLSLEAERFSDEKMLKAFKESQNRVASMALIHEELYKGNDVDNLDFAAYLRKLTSDLLGSYRLGNTYTNLNTDLDQVYLDMDTAIPLGIIVNELVSNALKHAFPRGRKGRIDINLCRRDNLVSHPECLDADMKSMNREGFQYILQVADNGTGISEGIDFETTDSLGLQLVNILVEQIDGQIELYRNQGTRFDIWFNRVEK